MTTTWSQLDVRSLAVFRMILGALILIDTLWRLPYLNDFMTDTGVLPRLKLLDSPYSDYWLSFHLGSAYLGTQLVLSLILAGFAVGLCVGWRTPWMAFGCWVMLNSLHARNPFINDRGDLQLSLMLFWAIFLPLGTSWSLDQRAGRKPLGNSQGIAAAGLILQFAWIYLFAALSKTGDFWLARGDGLKFSLLSPMFSGDLAVWLSGWGDGSLRLLNYGVVAGEYFVAFLLLSPVLVALSRTTAVVLLVVFHGIVFLLFNLGLFPVIGAFCSLVLLPTEFWQRVRPSDFEKPERIALPVSAKCMLAFFILLSLLSNLANKPGEHRLQRPAWLTTLTQKLKLEQHWELFAPLPPINGTFQLLSISPQNEETVIFEGPPSPKDEQLRAFPGHRWKMLMLASVYPEFSVVREGIAGVLAEKYGASNAGKLHYRFKLYPITQRGEFGEPVIRSLWVEP